MVGLLVASVGWSVGWLVDRSFVELVGQLVDRNLFDRSLGCLVGLVGRSWVGGFTNYFPKYPRLTVFSILGFF